MVLYICLSICLWQSGRFDCHWFATPLHASLSSFFVTNVTLCNLFLHVLVFKVQSRWVSVVLVTLCLASSLASSTRVEKGTELVFFIFHSLFTTTSATGVHADHFKGEVDPDVRWLRLLVSFCTHCLFSQALLSRLHTEQYLVDVICQCSHSADLANLSYL